MPISQALILDPDIDHRQSITQAFKTTSIDMHQVSDFESAMAELNHQPREWLLVSDELPLAQFKELTEHASRTGHRLRPATLFLARTEQSASAGLQAGASDYILHEDLEPERLRLAHQKAEQTLRLSRCATLVHEICPDIPLGNSPAYQAVQNSARKLAHSGAAVLIQGECGSGKSTLARRLHRQSNFGHGPLWDLDSTVVPQDQIESLIFGSETTTPSGKISLHSGLLELANNFGSILVREVHLLPEHAQEKLVHYLHNQSFTRVGGKETLTSNARILTTSSIPLRTCVSKNTFREDLFLILNSLVLPMPPLRERLADILPLAELFLHETARGLNKKILALAPECLPILEKHPWPGNVRELKQIISHAVTVCPDGAILESAHLFPSPPAIEEPQIVALNTPEDLASIEKLHIFEVLKKCNDNRTHAARRLGISIRTLRNKLREYRLAAEAEAA